MNLLHRLLGGGVYLFGALALLLPSLLGNFTCERGAVQSADALVTVRRATRETTVEVDAALDRQPVHVSGELVTDETPRDPTFGVERPGLGLQRKVEMYQWKEIVTTRKGGGQSYSYSQVWSATPIPSRRFQQAAEHANPEAWPWKAENFPVSKVTLGPRRIPGGMVADLPVTGTPLKEADLARLPAELRGRFTLREGSYFTGKAPGAPAIGDLRVFYVVVPAGPVSLVALQVGDTFAPIQVKDAAPVAMIRRGTLPLAEMIQARDEEIGSLAWGGRALLLVVYFFGFYMLMKALTGGEDNPPWLVQAIGLGSQGASGVLALTALLLVNGVGQLAAGGLTGIPWLLLGLVVPVAALLLARRSYRPGA